LFIIKNWFIQ